MSVELVEVLDRTEARWRVRVVLGEAAPLGGYTVGFVGADGNPLGPAVVAPAGTGREAVLEVRGPCTLPPGTVARIVLHADGGPVETCEVVVARRRGLHAWLSADARLPLVSRAQPEPLTAGNRRHLAARWCWFSAEGDTPAPSPCKPLPPDLREMLAEFGVDAEEVSDEVRSSLLAR